MPYVLGIDAGTSYTAAAISRLDGSAWSEAEVVRLGARSPTATSVLYLAADGSVAVGDTAGHRGLIDHSRLARGFSRRIGDDVPLVVGGQPCTAETLTAVMIMWVVDQVVAQEGAPPTRIVVTHPVGWGPYRKGLLHQVLRQAGLANVTLLPEPIAAAENHACRDHVDIGSAIAVYGLGSSTFEASVVRRTDAVFELLGHAESVEHLGGDDFDDALFGQLRAELGRELDDLDPGDPQARHAMSRLRVECTEAKEKLSLGTEATVLVRLPQAQAQVRLTRLEFEDLIRPALESTVDLLLRTVQSCAVDPGQLSAVLLVGGSARIPLVAELVGARLNRRVLVEADPKITIAKGAALAARGPVPVSRVKSGGALSAQQTQALEHSAAETLALSRIEEPDEFAAPPPRPSVEITALELPKKKSAARLVRGFRPGRTRPRKPTSARSARETNPDEDGR